MCAWRMPCRERAFPARLWMTTGLTPRGGGGEDVYRSPSRDRRGLRHQAHGSVLAQGSVGEGRAMEEFRQPVGTGEVCDPADRAGVPGAAQPTVKGSLHERA